MDKQKRLISKEVLFGRVGDSEQGTLEIHQIFTWPWPSQGPRSWR